MPIDETANDSERADAARDAANGRQRQIALRHFRRPWGCHPETNEAETMEPMDIHNNQADADDAACGLSHNTVVTVCDKCLRACCWQGEFMCDDARGAGTTEKTVGELLALAAGENPDYWLKDALMNGSV